jgi:glutamate--cysteine ligase
MVPPPLLHSLAALWVGLLYDPQARTAAWELTKAWSFGDLLDFQGEVARRALDARGPGGRTARQLAQELVGMARDGLGAWSSESGEDARAFLDPVEEVLDRGTLAERAVSAYQAAGRDPRSLVRFWQVA